MINIGGYKVKILNDGWTAVTCDKSLSAQFEHSLELQKMVMKYLLFQKKNYSFPPYLRK